MSRLGFACRTGLAAAAFAVGTASQALTSPPTCRPLAVPHDKTGTARVLARSERETPHLYRAIAANDLAAVRRHLLQNDNPNACTRGTSLLALAVAHGHMKAAELLVQGGASLEQPLGDARETVLLEAISRGWSDRAWKLVAMGAQVNAEANGVSALLAAAALNVRQPPSTQSREQIDLIQALALRGARVNAQTPEGHTPLMLALQAGRVDLIRVLLSLGADPKLANREGHNAIQMARSSQRADIEQLMAQYVLMPHGSTASYAALVEQHNNAELASLLRRHAVAAAPLAGRQALLVAAMRVRNLGAIELLSRGSLDFNAVMTVMEGFDEVPTTPLLLAVSYGMGSPLIEALVRAGADPNRHVALDRGSRPLEMALTLQDLNAARTLLRLKADPKLVARPGDMPPLSSAIALADIDDLDQPLDFARDLLDAGALVNARGPQGTTALHLAAMTANAQAIELLLKRGADPTLRDAQGKTALDHARAQRARAAVAMLTPMASSKNLPTTSTATSSAPRP